MANDYMRDGSEPDNTRHDFAKPSEYHFESFQLWVCQNCWLDNSFVAFRNVMSLNFSTILDLKAVKSCMYLLFININLSKKIVQL